MNTTIPMKRCSCGKEHHTMPVDAILKADLYWWNCSACGSTLVLSYEVVTRARFALLKDERARKNAIVKEKYKLGLVPPIPEDTSKPKVKPSGRLVLHSTLGKVGN